MVRAHEAVGSNPATRTTSEQALYRLLRLFYKSQSALMPLLLLSKSNPLRWASIWSSVNRSFLLFIFSFFMDLSMIHDFSFSYFSSWSFSYIMVPYICLNHIGTGSCYHESLFFFPFSEKKPHPAETNGSNRMRLLPFIISRCRVACERRNTYPFPLP